MEFLYDSQPALFWTALAMFGLFLVFLSFIDWRRLRRDSRVFELEMKVCALELEIATLKTQLLHRDVIDAATVPNAVDGK